MPSFSLFQPLPCMAWYMRRLWPLIFWRIQRLKKWFQDNGRPGSQMMWTVLSNGRVILLRASDDLFVYPPCIIRAPVSARLALALSSEDLPLFPLSQRTLASSPVSTAFCGSGPQLSLGIRLSMGTSGPIPDT
jgi:hypothetical protein